MPLCGGLPGGVEYIERMEVRTMDGATSAETVVLGRTGIRVGAVGVGTNTWGGPGEQIEPQVFRNDLVFQLSHLMKRLCAPS